MGQSARAGHAPSARRDGAAQRHAAESLREQILRGELVPGQRLVEADLAEQYGVTRASIRAALIDLAGEDLVERVPHRGARVRTVSLDEAVEITECRMVLEGLCAAKAATRASEAEVAGLRGLAEAMRAAVTRGDVLSYSQLNADLHRRVREISGQHTATRTIERLRGQIVRHQFQLALQSGRPQQSLPEHERIVAAIAARDPAAAEQAMRDHLSSVLTALRAAATRR
jgi:DNA-binding GntR family transcriptional regulator